MIRLPSTLHSIYVMLYILITSGVIFIIFFFQHCKLLSERDELITIFKMASTTLRYNIMSRDTTNRDPAEDVNFFDNHETGVFGVEKRMQNGQKQNNRPQARLFENLTVDPFSGQFFTMMSDKDDYTPRNFGLRIQRTEPIYKLNHRFPISGYSICDDHKPFLLILIPSMESHEELRQVLRHTWLRAAVSKRWPRLTIDKTVRYAFFLGQKDMSSRQSIRRLKNEAFLYRDIVWSDFVESYRNLSRKMITALQWVEKYCSQAEYILKLDEDTFVNVPLMIRLISIIAQKTETNKFVLGKVHSSFKPYVTRRGRWAVNEVDYPFRVFPRYMYGHSYVISRASVPHLIAMSQHVPQIPPEDVYLTGILTKLAKITRIDVACFTVCCSDLYDCDIVFNRQVTMTTAHTPLDHRRLWKSVHEKRCHPLIAFNHKRRHPNQKPVTRRIGR